MPDMGPPLGRPKPILWIIVIAGVAIWSILAWLAFGLVDPLLGWTSAGNTSVGSGLFGDTIAGLIGQLISLLGAAAKPTILVIWAIGAVGLLLMPLVLPKIIGLRRRFHH